ncbi:hypothetical protein [Bradyrhizobium sp. LMTR 3]|uniref:hypothetical protein n=1 Tax=Bradyrhizobium sp. LMTR 3 TaxID=189873 RepID=UPI001FDA0643|nr:hypothetical protein [Bradyrhizobium sp. LMTR 3]
MSEGWTSLLHSRLAMDPPRTWPFVLSLAEQKAAILNLQFMPGLVLDEEVKIPHAARFKHPRHVRKLAAHDFQRQKDAPPQRDGSRPEILSRQSASPLRVQLALVAQIHSHPGRAYHSSTDDAYAIATTVGCLSLVIPDVARAPFDLANIASYRLDRAGVWRALTVGQVSRMISIKD